MSETEYYERIRKEIEILEEEKQQESDIKKQWCIDNKLFILYQRLP